MDFLLVHPPLLGPAVWARCAAELAAAGHRVAVPDLRSACDPAAGWPERAAADAAAAAHAAGIVGSVGPAQPAGAVGSVGAAGSAGAAGSVGAAGPAGAAEVAGVGKAAGGGVVAGDGVAGDGVVGDGVVGDGVVVVGHSGAGVLLPLVADRVGVAAAVFVDALVPAADGPTMPSGRFRDFLDQLPLTDGRLPRWSEWWEPAAMAEQVPDAELRARIEAEQPRLARAFYAEAVPVPASWPPARVGYLQLSPAYEADAAEAADRGWPVRSLPGRHLDLATRPAEVAAEIVALAGHPDGSRVPPR